MSIKCLISAVGLASLTKIRDLAGRVPQRKRHPPVKTLFLSPGPLISRKYSIIVLH